MENIEHLSQNLLILLWFPSITETINQIILCFPCRQIQNVEDIVMLENMSEHLPVVVIHIKECKCK